MLQLEPLVVAGKSSELRCCQPVMVMTEKNLLGHCQPLSMVEVERNLLKVVQQVVAQKSSELGFCLVAVVVGIDLVSLF